MATLATRIESLRKRGETGVITERYARKFSNFKTDKKREEVMNQFVKKVEETSLGRMVIESIKKKKPNPKTIHAYCRNIQNLHRRSKSKKSVIEWLEDFDDVSRWLNKQDMSDSSRSTYVNSISSIVGRIVTLQHVYKKWADLNSALAKVRLELAPNRRYVLPWHCLMMKLYNKDWKTLDEYSSKYSNPDAPQAHVDFDSALCAVYTLFPPRRVEDYQWMRVTTSVKSAETKDFNWLVLNKKKGWFYFHKYKTAKKYGTKIFKISPHLHSRLRAFVDSTLTINKKPFVFGQKRNGKPGLNFMNFSKEVRRAFWNKAQCALSANDLRQSYISYLYTSGDYNPSKRKEIANAMAHSFQTQQLYVKKELNDDAKCM